MPILEVTPFPEAQPPYVFIQVEAPSGSWSSFSLTRNGVPVRVPNGVLGSESFYFMDYDAPFGEDLTYSLQAISGGWVQVHEEPWNNLTDWNQDIGGWGTSSNHATVTAKGPGSGPHAQLFKKTVWDIDRLDIMQFGLPSEPPSYTLDQFLVGDYPSGSYLYFSRVSSSPGSYNSNLSINFALAGSPTSTFYGPVPSTATLSLRKSGDRIAIFADDVLLVLTNALWDSIKPMKIRLSSVFPFANVFGPRSGRLIGYDGTDQVVVDEQLTTSLDGKGVWLYHAYDPLLSICLDAGDGSCADLFTTVDVARSLSRETNTTLLRPLGSTRDIAISTGPRRDPSWSMEIGTKTAASYDQVEAFFADDSPTRLEYSGDLSEVNALCTPAMRIPKGWHSPGSVTEVRDIDNWSSPLRRWQMSLDPVRPPTIPPTRLEGFGLVPFGVLGFGDDS